jgi:hypothetical protein
MQTPYILHVIYAMLNQGFVSLIQVDGENIENPLQLKFHDLRMPFCSKGAAS